MLELENARWDYLVIPEIADIDVQTIATWIKGMRTTKDKMVKAVLPNCAADFEGIVNFTNTQITTKAKTYTTAQYCSRIAGMIAGTPMTISCTFAPLPEVIDCDKYTKDQMDTKVGNGELFVMFDGSKYKIARGVNSFITTIQGKGDEFKKIKLVDLMDMIHDDIKNTANDRSGSGRLQANSTGYLKERGLTTALLLFLWPVVTKYDGRRYSYNFMQT